MGCSFRDFRDVPRGVKRKSFKLANGSICHATLGDGRNAVRIIEERLCKRAKIRGEQQPVSIPQWELQFQNRPSDGDEHFV